ncbi:EF-hand domain-containing protein [Loktanella sp. DJP18]|uniref:EF-hand domain-containing protein n=1 Tax=Loktanella sp. DJP18 TaxID=3409788 RepID=UPI003BB6AC70
MKTTLMMTTLLASLSLGAVAQAQTVTTPPAAAPTDDPMRPDFATLDVDGDGAVTQEEMQAQALSRFATADTDGDGGLSAEEMIAQQDQRRAARMARMIAARDTNGDGLLQAEEMVPDGDRMARMFDHMDSDADGSISAAEFDAMTEHIGRGGPGRGDHKGRGHDDRGGHGRSRG